jgi:hypothetical protein
MGASMQTKLSRRRLIQLTLAGTLALQAPSHALAQTTGNRASGETPLLPPLTPEVETRTLDEVYKAALAQGADLIVYAGGDLPMHRPPSNRLSRHAFLARTSASSSTSANITTRG